MALFYQTEKLRTVQKLVLPGAMLRDIKKNEVLRCEIIKCVTNVSPRGVFLFVVCIIKGGST